MTNKQDGGDEVPAVVTPGEEKINSQPAIGGSQMLAASGQGGAPAAGEASTGEGQRAAQESRKSTAKDADGVAAVEAVRKEFLGRINELTSERDALNERLVRIQIDQGICAAATKRGLRATALPDITARARNVFRLVQGAPVAYEADGKTVRIGTDAKSPMSMEEWIETQVAEAPHLFEPNVGMGSALGANAGVGGGGGLRQATMRNPWSKGSWNLTQQMVLLRTEPGMAARLKAAAS